MKIEQKKYLLIDVNIKNNGSNDVILNLNENPLELTLVESSEKNVSSIYKPVTLLFPSQIKNKENIYLGDQEIQPASTKTISAYTEIKMNGIYFLSFQAPEKVEEKRKNIFNIKKIIKEDEIKKPLWRASKYIYMS